MFGPKLKISKELYDKLKQTADLMGCSSVEEYAERVLIAETDKVLNVALAGSAGPAQGDIDAIAKKLKGLGYLE